MSHPARGAWIEMVYASNLDVQTSSHPARGAWIEILEEVQTEGQELLSHPARGAWIEIQHSAFSRSNASVAPRKGCVD